MEVAATTAVVTITAVEGLAVITIIALLGKALLLALLPVLADLRRNASLDAVEERGEHIYLVVREAVERNVLKVARLGLLLLALLAKGDGLDIAILVLGNNDEVIVSHVSKRGSECICTNAEDGRHLLDGNLALETQECKHARDVGVGGLLLLLAVVASNVQHVLDLAELLHDLCSCGHVLISPVLRDVRAVAP